tara:strand:+ start:76 stop:1089 length:1014 start_codon:yes stop_codon:yes gene_type:complete
MTIPWGPIIAALTTVGTAKYASNTRNDPKAGIGPGTAPTMQTGPEIQIAPVGGSQVQDFGDFGNENIAEPEQMSEQEELLAMLQEAGVDLEGLASLAYGGPVQKKNNGGGILDILDPNNLKQIEEIKTMIAQMSDRPPEAGTRPDLGVDFESGIMADATPEQKIENLPINDMTKTEVLAGIDPDYTQDIGDQTMFDEINYFAEENPEIFNAGLGALTKVISTLTTDQPKQAGSMVRTQTLPGNSARRRSAQMNIQPIGGSKVTFANEGTALKRPMFMPNGGQMRGPGGPKDDLIPVMASNGEYMLSKAAVDAAGSGSHAKGLARLDAFNKMGNKRYG